MRDRVARSRIASRLIADARCHSGTAEGERFITIALKNTDERIRQNKPVSPGFLFAILLWHEVLSRWNTLQTAGEKPAPALFNAIDTILSIQRNKLAIPRRFDAVIHEIWTMQPRFEARAGRKPLRMLTHPRFRAAFDFMLLRCESGELDTELGVWWKTFLSADSAQRDTMLSNQPGPKRSKRRRSRKKATLSNDTGSDTANPDTQS